MQKKLLYCTCDYESVTKIAQQYSKQYDLSLLVFDFNRGNVNKVVDIFRECNNFLILLLGINKSTIADSLLKPLEESQKNYIFIGVTPNHDMKSAVISRFDEVYNGAVPTTCKSITELIDNTPHDNLDYYIKIAEYLVSHANSNTEYNIKLVGSIIYNIKLCTNNIFWDGFYYKLKREFKC